VLDGLEAFPTLRFFFRDFLGLVVLGANGASDSDEVDKATAELSASDDATVLFQSGPVMPSLRYIISANIRQLNRATNERRSHMSFSC